MWASPTPRSYAQSLGLPVLDIPNPVERAQNAGLGIMPRPYDIVLQTWREPRKISQNVYSSEFDESLGFANPKQSESIQASDVVLPHTTQFGVNVDSLKQDSDLYDVYEVLPKGMMINPPPENGFVLPEKQTIIPQSPLWRSIQTSYGKTFNIRLFDFRLLRPDFTIVIYGKRRTGKTFGVRTIMKALKMYFPTVFVFTGTKMDLEYEANVPDAFIFPGWNPEIMDKIMRWQEKRIYEMRKTGENNVNLNVLIVLDDVITGKHLQYDEVIKRAFFNGRHYYITLIINSQDSKALGPELRSNTDMVGMFRVRSKRDKLAIRENFADFLENDTEFDEVMDEISEIPYNIAFFDQSRPYQPLEDTIYCGVMPPEEVVQPFAAGSRELWYGSEAQLVKYGMEHLMHETVWPLVNSTYNFKMTGPLPAPIPKKKKVLEEIAKAEKKFKKEGLDYRNPYKKGKDSADHDSSEGSDGDSGVSSDEEEFTTSDKRKRKKPQLSKRAQLRGVRTK